jgi:hypothetical protein
MADENTVQLVKESDFSFIRIHPFVFTINEKQKNIHRPAQHFNAKQQCALCLAA